MSLIPFGSPPTPNASTTTKGKVKLAGDLTGTADLPTVKTDLALAGNPTTTTQSSSDNSTRLATTAFIQTAIAASAAGLQNKGASRLATVTTLPTNIYNNGASGVGATLTGVSVGVLSVDGMTVALNDLIVVKNEAAQANNGIYKVTTLGTAIVVYVLTRVTNMDDNSDITQAYSFVTDGTTNEATSWNVSAGMYTVGTTAIVWNQFSAAETLIGGTGITVTGNLIDANVDNSTTAIVTDQIIVKSGGITDTQLSTVASGATVGDSTHIPVITFTNAGRVTGITTATISTSGATETFAFFQGN